MEATESLLPGTIQNKRRTTTYKNYCLKLWMFMVLLCGTITLFVYSTFKVSEFGDYRYSTFSRTAPDVRWTWKCQMKICEKQEYKSGEQVSLESCNMLCGLPQLWPMPNKISENTNQASSFFHHQFHLRISVEDPAKTMLVEAFNIFDTNVQATVLKSKSWLQRSDVDHFNVNLIVEDSKTVRLNLDTDESYNLRVELWERDIHVNITSVTFFGARHGLETLSQLIWWDKYEDGGMLKVLHDVDITDKPSFSYRGVMVDTARNYFPLDLLKRVIEGMAANKLNAFHWHLTDSQSFPFYAPSFKYLADDGAYAADMTYTAEDVKDLIVFAKIRGIRVIIEIDAPAHTLSGWEWGPEANLSNFIVKTPSGINGQLNPDNPYVLDILQAIYSDVLNLMDNDEIFHIGGDEVDLRLWMDLDVARNYSDVNDLWADFLGKIFNTLKLANNGVSPENIVIWSNKLTESPKLKEYFNPNSTIIQYWYGNSRQFIKDKFRVILSRVDHWYLDCGFGAWRESASPNCDPYRTWQTFYKATPWQDFDRNLVVGGEVCLWTEQVGEDSLETRLWPRTAAYAERIWSNPAESKRVLPDVYTRLDSQRTRLVGRGIKSSVFWPQWCTQNPGKC